MRLGCDGPLTKVSGLLHPVLLCLLGQFSLRMTANQPNQLQQKGEFIDWCN